MSRTPPFGRLAPDRPDPSAETDPTSGTERQERYVEAVLSAVEQIPAGRVSTYGDVAEIVGSTLGRGGPRQVGSVLAAYGSAVAWWRVVRADGRPARGHETEAVARLRAEDVPIRAGRVVLETARWSGPTGRTPAIPD